MALSGWAEANRHLLDYRLSSGAMVWDVGGYEGEWAAGLSGCHSIQVRVFEPIAEYAEKIRARGFDVSQYGLLDSDCKKPISIAGDRSSAYLPSTEREWVFFRDVVSVLGDSIVDVMKLNVEGAEYPILERLISAGKMGQIRSLLVQFHTFIPEFGERYLKIKRGLEQTHTLTWRNPFVWERWDVQDKA